MPRLPVLALSALAAVCLTDAAQAQSSETSHKRVPAKQIGTASVYSKSFQGRHMTDGERFSTSSDAAASRTLPIGTKAKVVDLQTGKTAKVVIKDHGPAPRSRIIDLTPHTAAQIGLTRKEGLAPVEVVPTDVPAKPVIHKADRF